MSDLDAPQRADAGGAPVDLRSEDHRADAAEAGRALPVVLSPHPRLSWIVPAVRQGQRQTAFQVVACRAGGDPRAAADLWDSGRVASDRTAHVEWAGPALEPHRQVRWSVRVWDERGEVSPWAEPADLIAGPFTADDWTARWIELPPSQAARTGFTAGETVRRARLHLAGHGPMRLLVDGHVVNPDAADPSRTALARAASRSYDVTSLLGAGPRHALAVLATLGQYRKAHDAAPVLVELVLEHVDGTTTRIGTGPSWRRGPTSVVRDAPYYLEERDARVDDGWAAADFDDSGWRPVDPAPAPPEVVVPDAGPPLTVVEEILAAPLGALDGRVFDVGRNIAGRSRVVLHGMPPGTRAEVVHGEKLDAAGHVETWNLRLPDDRDRERQVVALTCAGGLDVVEPWFAVHGFRYLEVRGVPDEVAVEATARVLHSDIARLGTFASDDPSLDRLVAMAVRTQQNNTHGHPEDCPTREQGGWTGDASVAAEAALAHLDMAGVYRNWLADVEADQRADGAVLGLSPHLLGEFVQPADPVWGSAMTEIPLRHWRAVGDESFVARFLPAMRRWCDWQLGTFDGGVVRRADISYGADWLAPQRTPPVLLQTAAVVRSLRALAELEAVAGDRGEAERRRAQADAAARSARVALHDPVTHDWADASQGSAGVALACGLVVDEAERRALQDHLRADVHGWGDRVTTGFAGTQGVVRALADADGGTALLAAVHQPCPPGVGAMLTDGPGTFWETWWIDDENVGVASLDHIALAAPFAAWAWTHVAGLRPLTAGYRRFAVAPRLLGPVGTVRARLATVRGEIGWEWRLDGTTLSATLQVPVGATAVLDLPATGIVVDGIDAAEHPHVLAVDGGLEIAAGRYRIMATGVPRTAVAPAVAAVPDVPVGGTVAGHVLLPGERDGYRVAIGEGWTATLDGDTITIGAAADVEVGASTELVLSDRDEPLARRVVRAGRRGQWLSDGCRVPGWTADPGVDIEVLQEFECSPVFHAPIPGPIIEVTGPAVAPGDACWVRLPFPAALDLGSARFAFADIDLCFPTLPGRTVVPTLRLTAADGDIVEDRIRPLPVCWNRIGVDLTGWPGRAHVVEVAVGVHWLDVPDPARGPALPLDGPAAPLPFRLGRVGWTSAPRTW